MIALVLAAVVAAHPLGNFTVNHYNGLKILPDRVENTAIVDYAELPTLQAAPEVDTDRSGAASAEETAAYATTTCAALARAQRLTVDGAQVPWQVGRAAFRYEAGQGGLRTSRLTCALSAPAAVSSTVVFADAFLGERIGWREITAVSRGVRLDRPPVPAVSSSDELRRYPADLLADPLDQRSVTLHVAGTGPAVPGLPQEGDRAGRGGTSIGGGAVFGVGGPVGEALEAVDRTFTGLVGRSTLTVPLGLLAVLLAIVLGAGHALAPGHGKTIMAAYLAGRRGRPRDALVVGATVTATHTAGVLVVGLLISALTTVAGESVLSWLGLASGLLIGLVGLGLLRSALRPGDNPGHGHGHAHGHGHGHGHGHSSLIGIGVAGGLVPSPSALIVLLGAAALGRTWFGVALVGAYGLGLAATLTVTGLLLVKLAARLDRLAVARNGWTARIAALAPLGTAALVVVLGAGLTVRSLAGVI
ncbi:hypothetical protein Sme01_06530 [Sphaerisporangium melleum]|uniref:High-affinity nickel-transporter n=1 Tax=Sphaerisporangium melleum TaxID=321316 RepID=A0A917RMK0_9ACTN|nr:High-affinity nickel-transporter [Sphaerisporangium melleum]GGL14288.1 hypothetical protein GCM10007964_65380 [Sphaerisporangium melleum]GII68177.1 hypothetical protein Sme01_06530 [Sphaerisporangium melleum]